MVPDSKISENTKAILTALGKAYNIPDNKISENAKAIIEALQGGSVVPEAPEDGNTYGRNNGAWQEVTSGSGGISDAPNDGKRYIRQSESWIALHEYLTGTFAAQTLVAGDNINTIASVTGDLATWRSGNEITIGATGLYIVFFKPADKSASSTTNIAPNIQADGDIISLSVRENIPFTENSSTSYTGILTSGAKIVFHIGAAATQALVAGGSFTLVRL